MAASAIAVLTLGVTATGAIGQYNAITAAGAVASAGGNAIGFAHTSGNTGDRVPVTALGTAIAVAGGAIAAGALVEVGASGKVLTRSTGVAIGRALNATSADGDQVEVFIIPN